MNTVKALVVGAVVVLGGLFGVQKLADATLTTHEEQDPDSTMVVTVHGTVHDEAEHDLVAGLDSLLRICQLEVGRDVGTQSLIPLGDDEFTFSFRPALDEADQRQFRGCFEDIVIDHLQASVRDFEYVAP